MAVISCKLCGGSLILVPGQSVAECDSCGTLQTVPSADSEKKLNLFTRANQLRAACDFDKAAGVYESIVAEFPREAEAYWGLLLCKYGIEYVDDPSTGKKIPTCHRSSFDSVLSDPDLAQALQNADVLSDKLYREEARQLEQIRRGIVEVSNREEPYDIFICYKETDPNGRRTLDSVIAQDIYTMLTDKGYRVFFSRVTLRDKLGLEYEPYIFAALNSAKVMLAVGTNVDYYNAVWVKNEWSRYLKLMASDRSKRLFPVYKGIGPYDLPQQMQRLQALNYGELGADQDLLMGIEKVIPRAKPAPVYVPQPAPVNAPQPAPAPAAAGGKAEQEAVALIKKGQKLMAIKVIREAYGLSLREAKDWADAAEQGNVRPLGNTSAPASAPAPVAEPGSVEREAVNLVKRGRYQEAIQLLRERFEWSKNKAEIWVSAVEQAGGVPSAADIAAVEKHKEAERRRKAENQQTAAPAYQAPPKQIPKGINDIAALLRANQQQEAIQLTGECYDLMGSKAAEACRRIDMALRYERYPRPEVPLAGERLERAWESASKAFSEMRGVVLEVQKNEAKVAEMVRAYNMATSEVKRNDYSSKIEYYASQVRYYFGRIGRWASDMEQAEAILKPAIEERKKAIESIRAYHAACQPRFDGIYQHREGQFTYCLRFFSDGTVITTTLDSVVQQIPAWFNHDDCKNSGKYTVSGLNISFSCTSPQGTVDYKGVLAKDTMDLEIHSRINGSQRKASYSFAPMTQNQQPVQTPAAAPAQAPVRKSALPMPKGLNDIMALINEDKTEDAVWFISKSYNLPESEAKKACRWIELGLRHSSYPNVMCKTEQMKAAWAAASQAFGEMRSALLELQKCEAKRAEMIRAYNQATTQDALNQCSLQIQYCENQIRQCFLRVQSSGERMNIAEPPIKVLVDAFHQAYTEGMKKYKDTRKIQPGAGGVGRLFLVVEGNGKQLPANKGLRYFFIVDGDMQKQILLMADAKTVATYLDLPDGPHTVALRVYGMTPSDLRAEVAPHQIQVTPSGIARVIANRPGLFGKQTLRIEYQG